MASGTGGELRDAAIEAAPCVPVCAGKTCGGDGCGGVCATCPSGQHCTPKFQCVTETPNGCAPGSGLDPQAPWPTAGRCYAHQSAVSVVSVQKPSPTWTFPTSVQTDPVIGRDGTLYFGTYASPSTDSLQALHPDGTSSWTMTNVLPSTTPTIGPDGTLYFFNSHDGTTPMWAVRPNGTVRWKGVAGNGASGVVVGADGTVYTGSSDGTLTALNGSDGSPRFTRAGVAGNSFPAMGSDGTLYLTYGSITAMAPDGTQLWQTSVIDAQSPYVGVTIGPDGTLYAAYGGPSVARGPLENGGLAALDPATGAIRWNTILDDDVYALPAVAGDGTIYVPSYFSLVAIAPTGAVLWTLPTGDQIGGVSIGGDGTIYLSSYDENFYAVNPDGTIRWTLPFGRSRGTPTIGADGTIYVRGDATGLTALGCGGGACGACVPSCAGKRCGPDGCGGLCGTCTAGDRCELLSRTCQPIAPPVPVDACGDTRGLQAGAPWPALGRCPTRIARSGLVGPHAKPAVRWSFTTGTGLLTGPVVAADGTIYAAAANGKLYAVTPAGASRWTFSSNGGSPFVGTPALGADGTIYAASGGTSTLPYLYAVRPDGSKRWSMRVPQYGPSSPIIGPDGTVYTEAPGQSTGYRLLAFDPLSGTLRWATFAGTNLRDAPTLAPDGTSYIHGQDVWAFDAEGAILWGGPAGGSTPFPASAAMVDGDGNVYALEYSTVVSFDPTGAVRWTSPTLGPNSGSLALGTDGSILVPIYSTVSTNPLVALDPATGAVRWISPYGGNAQSSPLVDASGWIYQVEDGSKTLYALDGAGKLQWSLVLPADIAQSPVLGANQTIYLSGTDAKLYAVGP